MKANKYITPEMRQIELGPRAIAVGITGSDKGRTDNDYAKKDNAWDDADSEGEW